MKVKVNSIEQFTGFYKSVLFTTKLVGRIPWELFWVFLWYSDAIYILFYFVNRTVRFNLVVTLSKSTLQDV